VLGWLDDKDDDFDICMYMGFQRGGLAANADM